MIDPGHGGNEPGAVGPTGLVEKDVNFDVAQDVKQQLEAEGAKVVLTRTADYNTTIKTRAEIAVALHPQVFLSIHHNAEPDGPSDVPGNETYYQIANPDSKRLAGLLWEEITAAFTPYKIAWAADTDHGAKYRPSSTGGDYYGILRRGAGITTVLSEAAFISNPPEEQLLATPPSSTRKQLPSPRRSLASSRRPTRALASSSPIRGRSRPVVAAARRAAPTRRCRSATAPARSRAARGTALRPSGRARMAPAPTMISANPNDVAVSNGSATTVVTPRNTRMAPIQFVARRPSVAPR